MMYLFLVFMAPGLALVGLIAFLASAAIWVFVIGAAFEAIARPFERRGLERARRNRGAL